MNLLMLISIVIIVGGEPVAPGEEFQLDFEVETVVDEESAKELEKALESGKFVVEEE